VNREEPLLAAVVIARNEERHIGACLQALCNGLQAFPGSPVVLVDSDSSDDTVRIASSFPVMIYRYRAPFTTAAAGRVIGFRQMAARYVLFVDGDSYIEGSWLTRAVALMEASPKAALIYGARQEMFERVSADFASQGPAPEEYGLGGNALYRSDVLREVNGFNPFIAAEEEGELLGRIQAAGYHAIRSSDVMFYHHTLPKDTLQSLVRRHRNRLSHGPGQILRLSITQGLFCYHARRFNRYLLMLAYLTAGVILSAAGAFFAEPWLPLLWIASGVAGFSWLLFRRRSLRGALCIVIDWLLVAVSMARDFFERPRHPELFEAVVERVK
jgi:glycosyltransferase involved in cell wall biosynthesis